MAAMKKPFTFIGSLDLREQSVPAAEEASFDLLTDRLDEHIKHRDQEDSDNRPNEHSAKDGRSNGAAAACAGTGRDHEGENAEDEGKGGHQHRAEALTRSGDGSLADGHSFLAPFLCEFHDEDGVLRGKAD